MSYHSHRPRSTRPRSTRPESARAAFLERQRVRGRGADVPPLEVEDITHREVLYRCFGELRRTGGTAPGPDGLGYADVSHVEAGRTLGALAEAIAAGTYVPTGTRTVCIPKARGGERRLRLRTIFDRTVGRALATTLGPYLEGLFLEGSWGFRPGRSVWRLLAHLEATLVRENRWVLATADVAGAFDHVVIADAVTAHEELLTRLHDDGAVHCPGGSRQRIADLVEVVLRGSEEERTVGIDQGDPYSPTALNVLLHVHHDVPREGDVEFPFWYRYADNLAYPCRNADEGHEALRRVTRELSATDLTTRDDSIVDLDGGKGTELLGYGITRGAEGLVISQTEDAWRSLDEGLENAHRSQDPGETAQRVLRGWLDWQGPALGEGGVPLERLYSHAAGHGFRETLSSREIASRVRESWRRWQGMRFPSPCPTGDISSGSAC